MPEAHTDFIFSILAEELGYIGVVLVLLMVFFIAFRAMQIGRRALLLEQRFFRLFSLFYWDLVYIPIIGQCRCSSRHVANKGINPSSY
ncbi:hypothetical protein PROPEN_02222 [Proteus penneri ATCC 35198]|nr:hypothetical protein PROPEN_02222 [Proteus penneri ATCC 35198]